MRGRKVSQDRFKNRLWAFIEESTQRLGTDSTVTLQPLGSELDRLVEEVNAAIHGGPSKERVLSCLGDLAKFTVALLQLEPEAVRRPYFPFQRSIRDFFTKAIADRPP